MSEEKKENLKRRLAAAREELLETLSSLTPQQWQTVVFSEDETWQASDLLGHMLYAEQGMTQLIERIKVGEGGVPEDFDLARWNARGYKMTKGKTPADLFSALAGSRQRLLAVLDGLEEDDWSKEGRHGSLQVMTIEQIVKTIALHERQHVKDISQAVF